MLPASITGRYTTDSVCVKPLYFNVPNTFIAHGGIIMIRYGLAIDIGASSGRHILGWQQDGCIQTQEIYRFQNGIRTQNGHDCWDLDALFHNIIEGLKRCVDVGKLPDTIAIDTWGVDYVLLDEHGKSIGDAVAYRDACTAGMDKRLENTLPFPEHYALTGISKESFNTVYQLMAEFEEYPERRTQAKMLLFMPCYLSYLLSGVAQNEYTIASTSGLLNAVTRDWDSTVLEAAGIPRYLLGSKPVCPGTVIGRLRPEIAKLLGFDCNVTLTASHDTASAFFAAPVTQTTACISSGTWSLLGVTLSEPVLTEKAREAGFTNEGGVKGIHFIQNIMGLWLLQRIRHEWNDRLSFTEMSELAAKGENYSYTFDVRDARFMNPNGMEREIRSALNEAGYPEPANDEELLFCVNHSLAVCYRKAISYLQELTGQRFSAIQIIGGGCQNQLLNRLTAQETGLPVNAGPVESTAIGNLMVQLL